MFWAWGLTLTNENTWIKNTTIARNFAAEGGIDMKLVAGTLIFDAVTFENNYGGVAVCLLIDFTT